ncbi:MAG: AAA family ATPase [Myxococcales bacterium]|nr:AAA family ATPase [Myxococcales bacterium]
MTLRHTYTFEEVKSEVETLRKRINQVRHHLAQYFVNKDDLVDLMVICTLAQEPLLLVGKPGTAKSDLIVKFAQAIGLEGEEYFEYMLTKFTEPSEIIGPIDINQLKEGRYLRRAAGKLPQCRVAFLDEIFKSNSAILNTLLTIINERKYYQDGKPISIDLAMLFGATNEIPEFSELGALRDRFTLKIESESVRETHFDELLEKGLRNETYKAFQQRPWENLCNLEDFLKLKAYLDHIMARSGDGKEGQNDRKRYFPDEVYALFKRIIKTLEKEDRIEISDRKIIKLYKLIRTRAFLIHGGVVTKEDLVLLRYVADRIQDFGPVREKVDTLLRL